VVKRKALADWEKKRVFAFFDAQTNIPQHQIGDCIRPEITINFVGDMISIHFIFVSKGDDRL
jgi:hypothetical protein